MNETSLQSIVYGEVSALKREKCRASCFEKTKPSQRKLLKVKAMT